MDFQEFFILLKNLFEKKEIDIEPSEDNFNPYLAARYISFIHPSYCVLMNETLNKERKRRSEVKAKDVYKLLYLMLPKTNIGFIEYVKKNVSETLRTHNITDEEINNLADYHRISAREVKKLLEFGLPATAPEAEA